MGEKIYRIQSVSYVNTPFLVIGTLVSSAVLSALFICGKKIHYFILPLCVFLFSLSVLWQSPKNQPYFSMVMAAAVATVICVFKDIYRDRTIKLLEGKGLYIVVTAETLIMVSVVSFACIMRCKTLHSTAFDFGLFAQMFESMATDFTQSTTLERGYALSHFSVHFSPIYYLLLPFYMIFRSFESLLIMQAVVCFSGVIPLLLLCKKWRYDNTLTLVTASVFLCVPAFTGGCLYDIHENCFLTPLILWLLYFLEQNKTAGIMISALMLLCVKEDAGFYIIFIGLYALFNKKIFKYNAVCLTIIGVTGFIAVTEFINLGGEGIKVDRYDIYLYGEQESLVDVILNVIKNPAFFLNKLLSGEKLLFLMQMLLPFLFIPIKTRKIGDWLLTVPFVIVNLATEYEYQYSIEYQYIFGTAAIFVFLFAKNLRYEKRKLKSAMACLMAAAVLLLGNFCGSFKYYRVYADNKTEFSETEDYLRTIPRDKVIYCSDALTYALYDCRRLYLYPFDVYSPEAIEKIPEADYVVLNQRELFLSGKTEEETQRFLDMGYRQIQFGVESEDGNFLLVFVKD